MHFENAQRGRKRGAAGKVLMVTERKGSCKKAPWRRRPLSWALGRGQGEKHRSKAKHGQGC